VTAIDTGTHTFDWSTVAPGWDARREHVEATKAALTEKLLDDLGLKSGERVLELGAGTGELARRLSSLVGSDGQVLASDVALGMVELIKRTTSDLPNVEVAQVDAVATGLADASFDAIVFRMGLMFVPQPDLALADLRRVLKPGGRLAATTWAAPEHNPWLVCVGMSAMLNGLVAGGLPTGPGGPLSLGEPGELERLAREAGFAEAAVEVVETSFRVASAAEHVASVTSLAPPLAAAFATASEEQRVAVRESVEGMMKQYRTEDGLVIPGRALLLRASR
jgi:SAM-dependent methyltransferase